MQSVYERANDIMRDLQHAYLMANRQRTLLATQYKFVVAVVLMLALLLPPGFAAMAAPLSSSPKPFRLQPLTYPVKSQDGNIIARPFAQRTPEDVMQRAKTPSLEVAGDYSNPFLTRDAIEYASNFSISIYLDRNGIDECGIGFPQWDLLQKNIYRELAVLTEIPATNFSPVVYFLSTASPSIDWARGYTFVYLDSLLGKKMLYGFEPLSTRTPSITDELGLLFQNVMIPLTAYNFGRQSDRAPLTWCWGCLAAVIRAATTTKNAETAIAAGVLAGVSKKCATRLHPLKIAVCVGAALSAWALAVNHINSIYKEKIINAKLDACRNDAIKPEQPLCPWTDQDGL